MEQLELIKPSQSKSSLKITPYYQDEQVTIYHADCHDIMQTLGSFDLVLTSPPYNIGKTHHNKKIDIHHILTICQKRLIKRNKLKF